MIALNQIAMYATTEHENPNQLIVCTSSAKIHWYSINIPAAISDRQYLKWNILNLLFRTMVRVLYIQLSVEVMALYYLSDKSLPQISIVISLHLYIYH